MVESKGWNWTIVDEDISKIWKSPSIESYYLLNRWKSQRKCDFLDLGCGLGRHSILFGKNGFEVYCFDISKEAIMKTREWANAENLSFNYCVGDMLELPYGNEQFDCIYCRNVISHTDTEGIKNINSQIYRVMKKGGECYLTLGSKDSREFKNENWPLLDENTRLRIEEGPEYKIPHFYADYNLIKQLFQNFEILDIHQVLDYYEVKERICESYHYHLLIRKN